MMRPHWTTSHPVQADNLRDMRDEAGDVAHHADSILDTMRHNPGVIEGCLSDEQAFALEDLLARLSVGSRRVKREADDDLGRDAR